MKLFIKQYISWIILLIGLSIATNILLWLDTGFVKASVIYLNVLYWLIVVAFLIVRAYDDRRQLAHIEEMELLPLQQYVAEHYKTQLEELEQKFEQQIAHLEHQVSQTDDLIAQVNEEKLELIMKVSESLATIQPITEQLANNGTKKNLALEWLELYNYLDEKHYTVTVQKLGQQANVETISLHTMIEREVRHFRTLCLEKEIRFEIDVLNKTVQSDAKWLAYAIRQLISNAVNYSGTNSMISIYTSSDLEGGTILHVRDAGEGMTAQQLATVFDEKRADDKSATGNSLYLVKQMTEQLGHELMLDSAVGLGTTAKIKFEAVKVEEPQLVTV